MFGDLMDVVLRNLPLAPDDVAKLHNVEQAFREFAEKVVSKVSEATDDFLDEVDERLNALEQKVNDLTNGEKKEAPTKKASTTK